MYELEVKVLSKAKKQEIIDALSAKLLDKELLTAWLLAAGKQEIEELELAMAEECRLPYSKVRDGLFIC